MLAMTEPIQPTPSEDSQAVTYVEVRWWAVWLDKFTARDLADAMGVSLDVGQRGVKALLWHGICEQTGVVWEGPDGPEPVVGYKPLPPGPTDAFTHTPEWKTTPGCYSLAPRNRGMPVRLVDNTDRRNMMQGTGGGRVRIKNRDKAYERMQEAIENRKTKQKEKLRAQHEDPKGKRKRQSDLPD